MRITRWLLMVGLLTGCGHDWNFYDPPGGSDSGGPDARMDVVTDATDVPNPPDVPIDTPRDVPADMPIDVRPDVPVDAPPDVVQDVPVDNPVDVPVDVPIDVPVDVPVDVPADVPVDVPVDAGCGALGSPCCAVAPICTPGLACSLTSTCVSSCAPNLQCGANCVNQLTDNNNCGTCGHHCTGARTCVSGTCM